MSPALDGTLQHALVEQARRAPSAHNTQPARWRFTAGGVELHVDPARALPVADPSGHDLRIALGAAWEGMRLALGAHQLGFGASERFDIREGCVVRAALIPGATPDPLADAVAMRATWRGRFGAAPRESVARLREALHDASGSGRELQLVEDAATVRWLVERADQSSLAALSAPAYFAELVEWLRLSPSHPGWSRDGLNAEALRLAGFERLAASWIARPGAHGVLRATGLLSMFAEEAPRARTATAVALLLAPRDEPPFEIGRRFYRLWLSITAAGWSLCPMSALADDPLANAEVRARCTVPDAVRLVNALRLGPTPPESRGHLAPRLPPGELIIQP